MEQVAFPDRDPRGPDVQQAMVMPELPEVETIRIGLERMILGAEIERGEVIGFPGVIEPLTVEQFNGMVSGGRVVAVRRRGKYLLLDLDTGMAIVVHLRMTGQLVVSPGSADDSRFERFRFHLTDRRQLRFIDQRKFGRVSVASPVELEVLENKLGVEPLGEDFTPADFTARLERRSGQIKPVLLDQSVVAGIGNIYADEALFRSGIHPQTPANRLSPQQVASLHANLRFVLQGSIDRGGTTFSSYRNASGDSGRNQLDLQIYGLGRSNTPCPVCGTQLQCLKVAGRSSHICPECQQLPE